MRSSKMLITGQESRINKKGKREMVLKAIPISAADQACKNCHKRPRKPGSSRCAYCTEQYYDQKGTRVR